MAAAVQDPGSANLVLVATITLQSSSPSAKQDIIGEKAACIVGKKRNPKSASNSKKKAQLQIICLVGRLIWMPLDSFGRSNMKETHLGCLLNNFVQSTFVLEDHSLSVCPCCQIGAREDHPLGLSLRPFLWLLLLLLLLLL